MILSILLPLTMAVTTAEDGARPVKAPSELAYLSQIIFMKILTQMTLFYLLFDLLFCLIFYMLFYLSFY